MPLTRDDILEHLKTEAGADTNGIDGETLLFSSGMIDSFARLIGIEDRIFAWLTR